MRAAFAGGGTAGHLFPCLAVAQRVLRRDPDGEVFFLAARKPLDEELMKRYGLPHRLLSATGMPYGFSWRTLIGLIRLLKGSKEALAAVREFHPQVILGCGGYIAAAGVPAAHMLGVPVVLHVSDAQPDRASLKLAPRATHISVAFEAAAQHFPPGRTVVSGQPVREEILAADRDAARADRGLNPGEVMLLVTGGSQGARRLNDAVIGALPQLLQAGVAIEHLTGSADHERVLAETSAHQGDPRYRCVAFQSQMGEALAAADLVVTRAGSSSLADAAAQGLPMIMVPYPHAGGHQRHNAEPLADRGAGVIVEDADFDGERLAGLTLELAGDPDRRSQMGEAAVQWGSREAADKVAELLLTAADSLAKGPGPA